MGRHPTHPDLIEAMSLMEMLQVHVYDGQLSSRDFRGLTIGRKRLVGKRFRTFSDGGKLYIVRVPLIDD